VGGVGGCVVADVVVCRKCKGRADLVEVLCERDVDVRLVRCQDVCKGAVAGVEVDGRMVWFKRVRGRRTRKALAKLARRGSGPIPDRLAPLHVRKLDSRPPR
jgi:hypothetical protein